MRGRNRKGTSRAAIETLCGADCRIRSPALLVNLIHALLKQEARCLTHLPLTPAHLTTVSIHHTNHRLNTSE